MNQHFTTETQERAKAPGTIFFKVELLPEPSVCLFLQVGLI